MSRRLASATGRTIKRRLGRPRRGAKRGAKNMHACVDYADCPDYLDIATRRARQPESADLVRCESLAEIGLHRP